jgi:DNA-directed RNA polymerase subunit RPC12/RpoP
MLACEHCNANIKLPARINGCRARTEPLLDLSALRQTTTHVCHRCGQTLLTARKLLRGQRCSRCKRMLRASKRVARPKSDDGMLRFQCDGCHKRLKAPASAAGRKAKCVRCGQRLVVAAAVVVVDSNPFVFT